MSSTDPSPEAGKSLRILALGTSTEWCSVALLIRDAGGLALPTLSERTGPAQSRRLLPMAETLLRDAGLQMRDLDAIAFDAGPGSFTGLRIGCGVAQGLGFALSLPLFPVVSLEALAVQSGAANAFVAIDARMNEVYCASYAIGGGLPQLLTAIQALPVAVAGERIRDWQPSAMSAVAIGDALERHPVLVTDCAAADLACIHAPFAEAGAIARIAALRFDAGLGVAARDAAPVYVRDKVALDVDEQRRLRESRASDARSAGR